MRVFWWLRSLARRFASNKHVLAIPICMLLMIMLTTPRRGEGTGGTGLGIPLLTFNIKAGRSRQEGVSELFKFKNFKPDLWNSSQRVALGDDTEQHFQDVSGHQCYIGGTDLEKSSKNCVCLSGFFGPHCGVPRSAWESHFKQNGGSLAKLKPRKLPRRLIHGLQVFLILSFGFLPPVVSILIYTISLLQVNHEFDLFEARLEMLKGVVDVYLMLESNYSSYGEPKPLSFLHKLQEGWLSSHQPSLLYILLPFFPKAGETNGWFADAFLRLFLGKSGMKLP